MKKHMFCFYHTRLYQHAVLPGDEDYRMPLLDTPQSIHLMAVHMLRSYLAGAIDHTQMADINATLRIALETQRRCHEPFAEKVIRDFSPIMTDVLGLDPDRIENGDLTYDMDPETCDNAIVEDPLSPDVNFQATPEILELLRNVIRKNPGMQAFPHKRDPEGSVTTDKERAG
jgi:hypothetical protein